MWQLSQDTRASLHADAFIHSLKGSIHWRSAHPSTMTIFCSLIAQETGLSNSFYLSYIHLRAFDKKKLSLDFSLISEVTFSTYFYLHVFLIIHSLPNQNMFLDMMQSPIHDKMTIICHSLCPYKLKQYAQTRSGVRPTKK